MIHKFHPDKNRWDGVEPHIYKENPGVFREVTKQILFDNENDLPVQFRYFQVEKNGFSSLEHHKHMHAVMIFKGKGHVLLGNQVYAVEEGDFLTIAPGSGTSSGRTAEKSLVSSVLSTTTGTSRSIRQKRIWRKSGRTGGGRFP